MEGGRERWETNSDGVETRSYGLGKARQRKLTERPKTVENEMGVWILYKDARSGEKRGMIIMIIIIGGSPGRFGPKKGVFS